MSLKTRKGFIFVISGPSGSGKTTIAKRLLTQPRLKGRIIKPVSFTTRPKRPGEKQGKDYCFVSAREFDRLLKEKKILEHTRYLGYDYGTPRDSVERVINKGQHAVFCLDLSGAAFIKKAYPDRAITIFVKPPSLDVAKKRILLRSNKTPPEEVYRRMKVAGEELRSAGSYDYCLVNDNLNKVIKEAKEIVRWAIYQ